MTSLADRIKHSLRAELMTNEDGTFITYATDDVVDCVLRTLTQTEVDKATASQSQSQSQSQSPRKSLYFYLEPEVDPTPEASIKADPVQQSIAISLKRIADYLFHGLPPLLRR